MGLLVAGTAIAAQTQNTWSGLYAGINTGMTFSRIYLRSQHHGFIDSNNSCNVDSNFYSFYPGVQLGYMHPFLNSFVTGVQISGHFNAHQNIALSCSNSAHPDLQDAFTFTDQGNLSVTGKAAYSFHNNGIDFLPYVTSGLVLNHFGLQYKNEGSDFYTNSNQKIDLLIGTGIEWKTKQTWSAQMEYTYTGFTNSAVDLEIPTVYGLQDPDGHAHARLNSHHIAVSIHYWIQKK